MKSSSFIKINNSILSYFILVCFLYYVLNNLGHFRRDIKPIYSRKIYLYYEFMLYPDGYKKGIEPAIEYLKKAFYVRTLSLCFFG